MKRLFTLLYLFILIINGLYASDTLQVRSIFDDFYAPDQMLEVTLQFDCKKLIRQKNKQEKFPGTITYQKSDGENMTRAIQVRTRGKLRLEVCSFPPLKLYFDKENLKKEHFLPDFDALKMVTHCQNSKLNDRQVLKELLVYKLYNIITEYSLRAQLLHVKYLDLDGSLYADEYAFLLEPAEATARRTLCRTSEKPTENLNELNPVIYNQMILFEYMIGNVDWEIRSFHNITMLKSLQGGARIAVPYDFDYSGVVAAAYGVPDERVGQRYLGERVLVNNFTDEQGMQTAVQHFLEREEAMIKACNDFELLTEDERQNVIKYLESFFELIKNPKLNLNRFTYRGGFHPDH